ncbi:MAG: FAD-binding oxidoreductase, partial [Gemmatimonadetes bacterium]|nr:FAD-binding oxidoreductase [Gemmatimonadota bacterium]
MPPCSRFACEPKGLFTTCHMFTTLATRLRQNLEGPVRFDALTRALYSTDASIYQIEPVGVVLPRTLDDIGAAMAIAREEGVPVLPRGAGTSQCGQAIGRALVVDTSRHLRRVGPVDREGRTVWVEPGVVLDGLNRRLAPAGLFFPVDVATASRATIGGMAGNNSGGARSIRYGIMADNVLAIEAALADGRVAVFGG